MGKRRISISDIIIGQPLPWDAYDLQGLLLLRQGSVVSSENQAQRMVKEGMYSMVEDVSDIEYLPPVKNEPSVVRILNRANWMLRKALPGLQALSNPQAKILEIADMLYHAIELNADVAVACIFLNQQPGGPYKFRHNTDTAIVAALVATAMGMQREEIITGIAAALTANLGMLDYQDHLDNKKGPLTDAEREHIRKHPMHGAEMLRNVGIKDEDWLSYILHHHENEDGSGYPAGKKGAEIPVFAKLIGLADRYTARVTSKDYRKPALPSTALKSIFLSKNQEIDSALAPYFIKEIGLYPPGSFVQLKSHEIALVVKRGVNPNHPVAMSVLNVTGMPQAGRIVRETANEEYTIRAAVHREIAGANIGMQRFWGPLAAF